MTLSTLTQRNEYLGTGALATLPYTFKILDDTDLQVFVAGVLKTLSTHYTVTGVGVAGGGNVVFVAGSEPAAAAEVVILRSMPQTQETDLAEGSKLPAETLEETLDRAVMLAQDLKERLDRAPVLTPSSTVGPVLLPPPGAGKYVRWNGAGTALELVDGAPGVGAVFTDITVNGNILGDGGVEITGIADIVTKGPWVDVRHASFAGGADPTGVADSFAAITAALAVGLPVFFPAGTYRTSATIEPPIVAIMIGVPGLSWIKPDAAVATTLLLESSNLVSGISLDGANTNGKKGLHVGAALNDYTKVSEMFIKNYLGAGGIGFHLADAISFTGDRIYAYQNAMNLFVEGGVGGGPTNTEFRRCAFRTATTQGVRIKIAYNVRFEFCLFEGNTLEGVKVAPDAGGTIIGADFNQCWFEGNYDATHYAFVGDGSAGGGATCRFSVRNSYFAYDAGSSPSKAIQIITAHNFVLENNQVRGAAGWISVEGTAYGFIDKHPMNLSSDVITRGANTTIVDIGDAEAWSDWTPTFTPSGGMTLGAPTLNFARYKLIRKTCFVELSYTATVGGVPTSTISISLPTGVVCKAGSDMIRPITVTDNAVLGGALLIAGGAGGLNIYNGVAGVTAFTAGVIAIWISCSFEIA